jgi:hypothetical protein
VLRIFRIGWEKVDATLIDQRFLRRDVFTGSGGGAYQTWEYLVAVPGSDGREPVRLSIREKTFKVDLPAIGKPVPVLVNPKRTKAVFDLDDPRIDAVGRLKAKERARKARDDARFEKRRKGG